MTVRRSDMDTCRVHGGSLRSYEAQVPQAIASAFREGKLGVMDYYQMQNIQADTGMRSSISESAKKGQ